MFWLLILETKSAFCNWCCWRCGRMDSSTIIAPSRQWAYLTLVIIDINLVWKQLTPHREPPVGAARRWMCLLCHRDVADVVSRYHVYGLLMTHISCLGYVVRHARSKYSDESICTLTWSRRVPRRTLSEIEVVAHMFLTLFEVCFM